MKRWNRIGRDGSRRHVSKQSMEHIKNNPRANVKNHQSEAKVKRNQARSEEI